MSAPLRVLIVDDSETDAKLVVHELQRAGHQVEVERVETEVAMRAALSRTPWDVVVSAWAMAQFSAERALAVLTAARLDVPFIIVSRIVSEEIAVEAMRAGACDFMPKDRLTRLAPAVERELREREVRTSRRQAEARFARLAESGIVGIAFADVNGNLLDANDAYFQMFGYTRQDLTEGRMRWADMTPPDWAERDAIAVAQLRSSGVAPPWEKEIFHKDGRRVPVLLGVAMLDGPNVIAFVADLTERKRAQAALAKTEQQLLQAQKMEAIVVLAGGVAHDFNNALSAILSYAGLATERLGAADPVRADLTEIWKAAHRAAALTRQLLAFGRRQVLQPRVVELDGVLKGMETTLRTLLGEDVELTFALQQGLHKVRLDPDQIEQVVINLAVNAHEAMPQGGRLVIETSNVDLDAAYASDHIGTTPGPHVMLAVSDTGTGMDEATQRRMFEPFFTTKNEARGLGLSTVHGIVQQSGGTIWVSSKAGTGTSFKIYFVPASDDVAQVVATTTEATALPESATILVVEEDSAVRALAGKILEPLGYEVLEAKNGGEALLICERHQGTIDLLLTDVAMPRMSGCQLAERFESLRPGLRVLYMSGSVDDEILYHDLLNSNAPFLRKPFAPEALAGRVRETLDATRMLRPDVAAKHPPKAR